MQTDFSILWVDDQQLLIESLEMSLKSWLSDKGFELKIDMHTNVSRVLDSITDELELIVLDYKLPEKNGDELIQEIRENEYYQDIVFYSEENLPNTQFNGVFFVQKRDAEARIKDLITLKLKRLSNPASVRGWIVADAIELEEMVTSLLAQCIIEKEGFSFAKRFLFDDNSPIDFGKKVDNLGGIVKDLVKWLRQQDKQDEDRIQNLTDIYEIYKQFKEEVVVVRNAVAHQRVEENEDGKFIKMKTKKASQIPFKEVYLTDIRNNLRKHHKNLVEMKKFL